MTWPRTSPCRLQQQALAVDTLQDRPAHLVGPEGLSLGDQGRGIVVAEPLHRHGQARVDDPDDLPERFAVGLDGPLVGLREKRGRGSRASPALSTDSSILRSAKRCRPSSIAFERSPSSVSGLVPGSVSTGSARAGTHANSRAKPQARIMNRSPLGPWVTITALNRSRIPSRDRIRREPAQFTQNTRKPEHPAGRVLSGGA